MKSETLAALLVKLHLLFQAKGQAYLSGWEAAKANYRATLEPINCADKTIQAALLTLFQEPREWPPSPGEIYQRIVEHASPTPIAEVAWQEALKRSTLAVRQAPSHRLVDDTAAALGGYDALAFEWQQGRTMTVRAQYLQSYQNLLALWHQDVRRELTLPYERQRTELLPRSPRAALTPWSAGTSMLAPTGPLLGLPRPRGAEMPESVRARLNQIGYPLETLVKRMPGSGEQND